MVLRLLRGEAAELLSREVAVPIYKLEQWRAKAEAALEGAGLILRWCQAEMGANSLGPSKPASVIDRRHIGQGDDHAYKAVRS